MVPPEVKMNYYCGIKTTIPQLVELNKDNRADELIDILENRRFIQFYPSCDPISQFSKVRRIPVYSTLSSKKKLELFETCPKPQFYDSEILISAIMVTSGDFWEGGCCGGRTYATVEFVPLSENSDEYKHLIQAREKFRLEECPIVHAVILDSL